MREYTGQDDEAEGTRIYDRARFMPQDLERAFFAHYTELREQAARLPPEAVLVAAVDHRQRVAATAVLDPTTVRDGLAYVVIGRHPQAHLRLSHDPAIALRHVLLRLVRRQSGVWELEARDLRTGQGFDVGGRGTLGTARAPGHLFFRLGSAAVLALPRRTWPGEWPATAAEAWASLPGLELSDVHEAAPANDVLAPSVPQRRPTAEGISRVISLAPSVELRARPVLQAVGPVAGNLTIHAREGFTRHLLTVAELERGVLLGRYERCQVGAELTEVLSWSRVHALLVMDGERLLVYDTASTCGTVVDASHVDCAELGRRAVFTMGPEVQAVWERRAQP